jgi:hypothetical protein
MKTLISKMLRRREEGTGNEIQAPSINPEAVYQALMDGLDRMETEYVDRVVISLHGAKPRPNPNAGEWIPSGKGSKYYPFEMLEDSEQEMISNEKTYVVDSLVRKNVRGIVEYGDEGIERFHRTHRISAFLPGMISKSNHNYSTEGGLIASVENIRDFAKDAARGGWSPEAIGQVVDAGIEEYHKVTRRLMESEQSPFERLMYGVREKINSAKTE